VRTENTKTPARKQAHTRAASTRSIVGVKAKTEDTYIGEDWIPLSDIIADPSVQSRAELDEETVADYSRAMLEQIDTEKGLEFPPCIVFCENKGKTIWLSEGFHRFNAALRTGGKVHSLFCEMHQGGRRDALLHALGANTTHGLRRTSADKRKAVSLMLLDDEWKQWSSSEIARRCSVSHTFVDNVRRNDLSDKETIVSPATVAGENANQDSTDALAKDEDERRKYITKHGTETTMRTGKRRARKKAASDEGSEPEAGSEPGRETEPTFPVADPNREERPDKDERGRIAELRRSFWKLPEPDTSSVAGSDLEVGHKAVKKLTRKIEDQAATIAALQSALDKREDTDKAKDTIIRDLQKENANLRAGAAPSEPQTLAQMFNRIVDMLALIDHAFNAVPDPWPEKVSSRTRNQQIKEVRDILPRIRRMRDAIELHSGESEEEQP
jgi:hypothetical protein